MSTELFNKASPLLNAPAPALSTLLGANIEMLNGLIANFSGLDLTEATKISLAVILSGQQPNAAIAAAAVLVQAQAKTQSVEINDQEANIVAQAVVNGVLAAVQVAVSTPTVVAKQPEVAADQGSVEAGEAVAANAA